MGEGAAVNPEMRCEVLGPLRVRLGRQDLSLGGPKPRALLATLLLHPNQPVGLEVLTDALWDGEPPASAPVNLRAYVRTLRRALDAASGGQGDVRLETRAPGYLIRVEPGELDLQDFEDLDARARQALERGETGTAAGLWRQALDLWRGRRPLADVRGGPWLTAAVVRLEERRLRVAEAWIDAQLDLGAHAELVGELRGLVAADPLHEPLWARLMVALHRAGRTADALAAYGQARQHLIDDLGVEPGRQLQRLHQAILAGDPVVGLDGAPSGAAPQVRADATPRVRDDAPPSPRPPAAEQCPYQGLPPFDVADAALFFGRERLVAELVTRLTALLAPPSLLAVVGPCGSGTSSVLRAGLLRALASGVVPAVRDWPTAVVTPGARPLATLSEAIARIRIPGMALPEPGHLDDPRDPRPPARWRLPSSNHVGELIRGALGPTPGRRLVLVVDQLEELFTLCKDERERQAFISAVSTAAGARPAAATDAAAPAAVVVLGLRAEFRDRCAAYPELTPILSGDEVVVGPMTHDELRHAIERPAARSGLTFEPGLVDRLVADAGLDPASGTGPAPVPLPPLSHALLATWWLRDGDRLTVDAYRMAGGVDGAIATTADAVYEGLEAREQTVVRQLFTRLVALGEGTADTGRRITRDELLDGRTDVEVGAVAKVLDAFAQARLIVMDASTVALAHEVLITRWPRLQRWLTDDRDSLRAHRRLTEAAQAWAASARDPGAVYRGAELTSAREWAAQHEADLNALERAFLDASADPASTGEVAARHRAVRVRRLVAAILILLLLVIAGAFALRQVRQATSPDLAQAPMPAVVVRARRLGACA